MIYFLRRADGAIKIGYSSDVLKCKVSLEVEHGSLELLGVTEGSRHEEKLLYRRFAEYRVKRTEWFSPDSELLSHVVKYTHLNISKPPDLWTTIAVSRRLSLAVKTLATSLNMTVDDFLWYVLGRAYPEKTALIEQLLATEATTRQTHKS